MKNADDARKTMEKLAAQNEAATEQWDKAVRYSNIIKKLRTERDEARYELKQYKKTDLEVGEIVKTPVGDHELCPKCGTLELSGWLKEFKAGHCARCDLARQRDEAIAKLDGISDGEERALLEVGRLRKVLNEIANGTFPRGYTIDTLKEHAKKALE